MNDITLLYYTANRIHDFFAENIRRHLVGFGLPIVSVSHKEIDFGHNICVGDIGASVYNIYKQILIGAREVETDFVACCEDDCLYTEEHFNLRPEEDAFYYNTHKWTVQPTAFTHLIRSGMCMCIVSRLLLIETLEVRFKQYPNASECLRPEISKYFGEPGRLEHRLRLPPVEIRRVETTVPTLTFSHKNSMGGRRKLINKYPIKKSLPFWGDAKGIWERYHG